jgi:hypothetical protein
MIVELGKHGYKLTRLVSIPLLIVTTVIATTEIPELFGSSRVSGIW